MARFAFFTLAQIVLDAPPSWWFAAYKFTLPASKRLHIDQLNAEMGAPPLVETPAPWLAWSASVSGGPRPCETPCRARA